MRDSTGRLMGIIVVISCMAVSCADDSKVVGSRPAAEWCEVALAPGVSLTSDAAIGRERELLADEIAQWEEMASPEYAVPESARRSAERVREIYERLLGRVESGEDFREVLAETFGSELLPLGDEVQAEIDTLCGQG